MEVRRIELEQMRQKLSRLTELAEGRETCLCSQQHQKKQARQQTLESRLEVRRIELEQMRQKLSRLTELAEGRETCLLEQQHQKKQARQQTLESRLEVRRIELEQMRQKLSRLTELAEGRETCLLEQQQEQRRLEQAQDLQRRYDAWQQDQTRLEQAQRRYLQAQQQALELQGIYDANHRAFLDQQAGLLAQTLSDGVPCLEQAQRRYLQAQQQALELQGIYDANHRAFLDQQAGLLAQTLSDGVPCPVCGSPHHPAPAALEAGAPTQDQVRKDKQQAEDASRTAEKRSIEAGEWKGRVTAAWESLSTAQAALLPEASKPESGRGV